MKWTTLKSDKKADFPLFKVYQDLVKLPNGLNLEYYRVEKVPAVVILPIIDDKIIFVKQYRYPIKSESLELPAGHMKQCEDPIECAKRELKEETGYETKNIEKLISYHPSTEYSDQVYHVFIATNLIDGKPNREKYELMDIEKLSFNEIIEKINHGKIKDGRTILAIFLGKYLDKI